MACWASLIEQFVTNPEHRPDDSCTEELPEVNVVPDLPSWAEAESGRTAMQRPRPPQRSADAFATARPTSFATRARLFRRFSAFAAPLGARRAVPNSE